MMLLAPHGGGRENACNITGDTKTMAAASTSSGHRIVVSVCREPSSPALSRICLCFRPTIPGTEIRMVASYDTAAHSTVVATHGGSVLVHISTTEDYLKPTALDYFVYTNAAGDARPPSLLLLPPRPPPTEARHYLLDKLLDVYATGFLCRGEAEFLVAQLTMLPDLQAKEAELLLFRNGEWRLQRPSLVPSCHGRSDGDPILAKWRLEAVVPVGDRVLCWVDFFRGVILSDVFHQTDVLWYVPYPAEARPTMEQCFLCTNSSGELKLVSVKPRRCSHCGCSQHASTVDTWTLDTERKVWVLETGTTKSSMVDDDSTELWAIEKHSRQHLVYPTPSVAGMNGVSGGHVVSSDDRAATAPTTIDEKPSLQSSHTLSMPSRVTDRVVRRSPRILHKNIKDDKGEYPHISLDYYGPRKRHKTVQVEELKLGNPSNSTSPADPRGCADGSDINPKRRT